MLSSWSLLDCGAPLCGSLHPLLSSLKKSPSLMVTASRVGLQVKGQDSVSAVEEPLVWVPVLIEGRGRTAVPSTLAVSDPCCVLQ